jgi:hypothetical protein
MGTWKVPGTDEVNQIDHVPISLRHSSSVIDVRSHRGPNCDSDHYLVKVKVREGINKTQIPPRIDKKKWDVEKLGNDPKNQNREAYQQMVKVKLQTGNKGVEEEELDVEEQWKKIQRAIKEAAEETIHEQKPARKNMARQKMLEKETRANTERYQELRREANRICNKKKEKMKRQLEEIEKLSKQNERRKFYKAVHKAKKGFQPKITNCKTNTGKVLCEESKVSVRPEEHFKELLNKKVVDERMEEQETGVETVH